MLYRECGVVRIELFGLLHPREAFLRSIDARKETAVDCKDSRVVRCEREARRKWHSTGMLTAEGL